MAYKLFGIIGPGTPKPWGAQEETNWKDVIDTMVNDCVVQTKDSAGHKHGKLYGSDASELITGGEYKNIGINKPSALKRWYEGAVNHTTLQFGNGFTIAAAAGMSSTAHLAMNAYYDHTDARWEYLAAGAAATINLMNGQLSILSAPVGTNANDQITWENVLIANNSSITAYKPIVLNSGVTLKFGHDQTIGTCSPGGTIPIITADGVTRYLLVTDGPAV
jgi:hypothetical protein